VEDDDVVRQLTCTVLQRGGYKILEAKNANDALELQKQHKDAVGLVLTDLVMPGISGLELGEKLKEVCSRTKVLYTSGYSDDVIVRHGHLDPGMPFIQKPFGSAALLQKVRDILDLE
jgi:DNA-binding NtrC family response regulator